MYRQCSLQGFTSRFGNWDVTIFVILIVTSNETFHSFGDHWITRSFTSLSSFLFFSVIQTKNRRQNHFKNHLTSTFLWHFSLDLANITSPPWTFGERFDFLSHCSILHFFHVFLWKNKHIVDRSNTYQSQNSWSNQRCLRDIGTLRYFAMIILFCLGPIGLSNSDAFLVHFAAGSITVDSWLRLKSDHLLVWRC